MRVYVDGVACYLEGGALSIRPTPRENLPMQIGAADPRGGDQAAGCAVDEVAIYSEALPQQQMLAHLEAGGWGDRHREVAAVKATEDAKLEGDRHRLLAARLNDPALFARGRSRVYEGKNLGAISFPLGGIGTGNIHLDGKGRRSVWQIFNNHSYASVPNSFLAVRTRSASGSVVARALQSETAGSLPGVSSLKFRGEYPFAWYDFEDDKLPIRAQLTAFTPLIPMNEKDSAIPCAVFDIRVTNSSREKVTADLLASQQNAVGFTGEAAIEKRSCPQ
ncbi:MAG: glucosylceramidase, partial [bacterium]|nr:glucosylceramidase [bacterium]